MICCFDGKNQTEKVAEHVGKQKLFEMYRDLVSKRVKAVYMGKLHKRLVNMILKLFCSIFRIVKCS